MFSATLPADSNTAFYPELISQLRLLIGDETDATANLANASALIMSTVSRLNWAGFYMLRDGELVVGPFQGRPACIRISLGRGVCGTAASQRRSILVDDVDEFPGHIACDAASKSELVVPMIRDGELLGVLDLDSPERARFSAADVAGMEQFVAELVKHLGG